MSTIRTQFDGRVFVPEQPVNLPPGTDADVVVSEDESGSESYESPSRSDQPPQSREQEHVLTRLLAIAKQAPVDPNAPTDMAAEHDHYLYGTPKKNA